MAIAHTFKRFIASVSAGAIFASLLVFNAGNVSAAWERFNDVGPEHWGYEAAVGLANMGVLEKKADLLWNTPINRAEAAKSAVLAADLDAGCQVPAEKTFKDTVDGAWYMQFVECAAAAGVIMGDSDPVTELPLGTYRPGDSLNRAEAAAITARAFDINPLPLEELPFPDSQEGAWYEVPVQQLYTAKVLVGDQGMLRPGDDVSRMEFFQLLWKALKYKEGNLPDTDPTPGVCDEDQLNDPDCDDTPVGCDETDPNDPDCLPAGPSDGDLEVSLSESTPKAESALALKANGISLAKWDFTAVGDDVTLTKLTVERSCTGKDEDWDQLYLYNEDERVTTGRTLGQDDEASFPLKLAIPAGETLTLTLKGDVAAIAGANNRHCFQLTAAESVGFNGQEVTGDFPLTGDEFSIAGPNSIVNTVKVEAGPDPSEVLLGEKEAELASMRFDVGSQSDVMLYSLALQNAGSFDDEDVENLVLEIGDEKVAKVAKIENDLITFVLEEPYLIKKGQTKTAHVLGDLIGGKGGETFIWYLEIESDAMFVDTDFDQGADIDNQFQLNQANTVTVKGGDFVVSDNGPESQQVANDSDNVTLLEVGLTADRLLNVKNMQVAVTIQDPAGFRPTLTPAPESDTVNAVLKGGVPCLANEIRVTTLGAVPDFTPGDMFQVGNSFGRVRAAAGNIICAVSSDTLSTGTINEVNPADFITDVEAFDVTDEEDPISVAGPLSQLSKGTLCTAVDTPLEVCPSDKVYATNFADGFDVEPGETMAMAIQVDIEEELVPGYQLIADLEFADNSIKDEEANQFLPDEDVVGDPIQGDPMIVTEDDLLVSVAANPVSDSYVKGALVDALGINLAAGDSGDITVDGIKVRAYGCDGITDGVGLNNTAGVQCFEDTTGLDTGDSETWESAFGNFPAKDLISTITLYYNGQKVGDSEAPKLVDSGNNGFTAGTDFFEADFDDLNLVIPAGTTKGLVAKVQLLNTITGTKFFALDVNPADIEAEDEEGDEVIPSGDLINGAVDKNPLITVGATGNLTATAEGNPDADILVMGTQKVLVARYRFDAVTEAFTVRKATIFNDLFGRFDKAEPTGAISSVTLKYPKENNAVEEKTVPFGQGFAKFSDINFYVPDGQEKYLEIYANISNNNPKTLEGEEIRLGLQQIGNTIESFEALGKQSGKTLNFNVGNEVSQVSDIETFVVRMARPVFENVGANNGDLIANESIISKIKVTANGASVGLQRLTYELDLFDANVANLALDNFKLFKGPNSDDLVENVSIVKASNNASVADGQAGVVGPGTTKELVYITFDDEEAVIVNSPLTFTLKATVVSPGTDDTISTRLAIDDENTPVRITNALTCGAGNNVACTNGNSTSGKVLETNQVSFQTTTTAGTAAAFTTTVDIAPAAAGGLEVAVGDVLALRDSAGAFTPFYCRVLTAPANSVANPITTDCPATALTAGSTVDLISAHFIEGATLGTTKAFRTTINIVTALAVGDVVGLPVDPTADPTYNPAALRICTITKLNGDTTAGNIETNCEDNLSLVAGSRLTLFGSEALFSQDNQMRGAVTNLNDPSVQNNIVWSAKSAEPHNPPVVVNAIVTTNTGSNDWNNGQFLNLTNISPFTLSKN